MRKPTDLHACMPALTLRKFEEMRIGMARGMSLIMARMTASGPSRNVSSSSKMIMSQCTLMLTGLPGLARCRYVEKYLQGHSTGHSSAHKRICSCCAASAAGPRCKHVRWPN